MRICLWLDLLKKKDGCVQKGRSRLLLLFDFLRAAFNKRFL